MCVLGGKGVTSIGRGSKTKILYVGGRGGGYGYVLEIHILTMERFLDVSTYLYSGGWQVCITMCF